MKRPTDKAMRELAARFGAEGDELEFLGGGQDWSDGTLYRFGAPGARRVIKFLGFDAADAGAPDRAADRVRLVEVLAGAGCRIVRPRPSRSGRLHEVFQEGDALFLAYSYAMAEGPIMGAAEIGAGGGPWVEAMGRELAAMHAAWEGRGEAARPDGTCAAGPGLGGWRGEAESFRAWCADPEVSAVFAALERKFAGFPVGRREYGFVHNDFHPGNLVVEAGPPAPRFTLLDFDVANFHWFACDAATALHSLGVFAAGGPETGRPLPAGFRARCEEAFWGGYAAVREPGAWMKGAIPAFTLYRSCLMFTVFQEMTAERPEWRAHWKGRIAAMAAGVL